MKLYSSVLIILNRYYKCIIAHHEIQHYFVIWVPLKFNLTPNNVFVSKQKFTAKYNVKLNLGTFW